MSAFDRRVDPEVREVRRLEVITGVGGAPKRAIWIAFDTTSRTVRPLFISPERRFFEPAPVLVSCNLLNHLDFNIRTKMAVVRLRRRKWAGESQKRPEMGLARISHSG
jgi:hypothetical protein